MKTRMKFTGMLASMMIAVLFTAMTFEANAKVTAADNSVIAKIIVNIADGDNTYFAKCDAAGSESKKTSDKAAPTAKPASTTPTATPASTTPAAKPAKETKAAKATKEGKCGDGKCGDSKSDKKKTSEGKCGTSKF
jgi:uncharacterized low-complexity protein